MPFSSSCCCRPASRLGVLLLVYTASISLSHHEKNRSQAFLLPSASTSRCHGRLLPLQQSSPAEVIDADDVRDRKLPGLGRIGKRRKAAASTSGSGNGNDAAGVEMVQMSFLGEKMVTTSPVPFTSSKDVQDFFIQERFRNLLFFRNDVTTVHCPTNDMMCRWSSELKLGGGAELDNIDGSLELGPNESIIRIKTNLSMPGLQIMTINTIGAKLLLEQPGVEGDGASCNIHVDTGLPEYQFTLLESELVPEGAPPLVWLFNKLIRFRDTTSSFTRVRVNNAGGVDCDKVIFTTQARLETRIQIPQKSMIAIPGVDVAKFERQGSKSIQKLLEKELEPALNEFRSEFARYIE